MTAERVAPELVTGADVLRAAARLMRERASVATPGPWRADVLGSEGYSIREVEGRPRGGSRIPRPVHVARCGYEDWDTDRANAAHIASWSPEVAVGVADWLDSVAILGAAPHLSSSDCCTACSVARAYLGESA